MFNTELLKPGNLCMIVAVALVSIIVFNVLARKFSLFNPKPPSSNADVQQYAN
jgi:hypothetical protein